MPEYKPYPNSKDTPSRKSRKGSRNTVFVANKIANRKLLKVRKEAAAAKAEENEQA